ncbi:MAG: YraN family protein [Alphaproteobacteria bacterium]
MLNFLNLFFSKWLQRRKNKLQKSYYKGLSAENWVRWILILKGYCILAHRFRTPAGEVDLIAGKKGMLLLVEVKARASLGEGIEALRFRQRARLLRSASFVAASFPKWATDVVRFDLVVKRPWRFPYFLKNVLSEFN